MDHYLHTLQESVKACWDKQAVCNYNGESFTFGQMAENIEKLHVFFEKAGIVKGEKITLCARNSARWAISFFAINTYETVAVPLLADFLPDNIATLTSHSESAGIFIDPDTWEKIDKSLVPDLRFAISVSDFSLLFSADETIKEAYDNIPAAMVAKYPMGFCRENVEYPSDNWKDLTIINYTSGTTSAPKGVMILSEAISATLDFSYSRIPVNENDTIVSILPMGHIFGLIFEFIYPICKGASITFFGKTPSPTLLLRAMKDVRPFLVFAVPLVMEKVYKSAIKPVIGKWYMKVLTHTPFVRRIIFKKIGAKIIDAFGGKVSTFIMGGAALNPEVEKCFKNIRLPYIVGYGMTEATPLLTFEFPEHYVAGSCGKPISHCDIRIDSEDPQHIAGEIQAKGPNICIGYFNNPEATAGTFTKDGYLHTGDLGIMDADGNIFIKGRSKNMILSANGQNIYPEELEAVINSQDFIAESVVVDRASKLVALIYLDQDAIKKAKLDDETISDIPEKVRINANRLLPSYSQIAKVEVVLSPFEKTPKMSIKRFLYS